MTAGQNGVDSGRLQFEIENIVVGGRLADKFDDLNGVSGSLANSGYDVTYNQKIFPAVIVRRRIAKAKSSIRIFRTGRFISSGHRSVDEARDFVYSVLNHLRENRFIVYDEPQIRVQNVVAKAEIGGRIDLSRAAQELSMLNCYEPDIFPALILWIDPPRAALVFASGKVILAGLKTEDDVAETAQKLYEMLRNYLIVPEEVSKIA